VTNVDILVLLTVILQ